MFYDGYHYWGRVKKKTASHYITTKHCVAVKTSQILTS